MWGLGFWGEEEERRGTDLPLRGGGRVGVVDRDGAVDGAGGEAAATVVPAAACRAGTQLRDPPLRHSPLDALW